MPRSQARLSHEEHLILVGFVAKSRLDKALEAFKTEFRDPITRWLRDQPEKKATVLGRVKAVLVETFMKPVPNVEKIKTDLLEGILGGRIQESELVSMLESGLLVPGDPVALSNLLSQRLGTPLAGYTTQPANRGPIKESLRLSGVRESSLEELASSFRRLDSLSTVVEESARREIPTSTINRLRS